MESHWTNRNCAQRQCPKQRGKQNIDVYAASPNCIFALRITWILNVIIGFRINAGVYDTIIGAFFILWKQVLFMQWFIQKQINSETKLNYRV